MTSRTVCLDFGNTRLKAGIFNNNNFKEEVIIEDDSEASIAKLLQQFQPNKVVLSSVINHRPALETQLAEGRSFHLLSHLTKINFTTTVGKPETIGADRLALMAAAAHFYPQQNNLVIALGSCITYNFLNQYH
ncbi:MAG: type III pantothenate kinase, partial [Ferruginibacter sp.]